MGRGRGSHLGGDGMRVSTKRSLTRGKKARGDAAAVQGRLEEAHGLFGQVCRTDPADAEAWVKLAMVERRLGRLAEAETSAHRALTLAPGVGFAHHVWAVAVHAQGRFPEAVEAYRHALKCQPGFADAHFLLACALRSLGQTREAAEHLKQALARRPDYAEALSELGALNVLAGDHATGLVQLQRAAQLQPGNVETQCNLAQALRLAGRMPQAISTYRQTLQSAPNSASAWAGLAQLLERVGQLDESRQCLERARALAPLLPDAELVAARLMCREKRFEQVAARLHHLLASQGLAAEISAEAELLLGQVLDQLNRPEAALDQFTRGKARRSIAAAMDPRNDPAHYLRRVEQLRALCSDGLASAQPLDFGVAASPADPVFLIGFPRSGTTLLEQMLDAHPQLVAMDEQPAVSQMLQAFWDLAGDDPAGALAGLGQRDASHLRDVYRAEAARHVQLGQHQRLVDKLPLNTAAVPVIWRVFPRARFIFALRHPCDVVLSCFMQDFAPNTAMASFNSLAGAARLYQAVMSAWLHFVRTLPLVHFVNRYEDLIADPPGELRRLCTFLDLPWDDGLMDHVAHARQRGAINTPSYQQVTQPIYRSAADRWRRYQDGLAPVLSTLRPFIGSFGYTVDSAA